MLRFLLEFLYSSHTVHEFLPSFGSRSSPENRIRRSRTRVCFQMHHKHVGPPAHRNHLALLAFSMYDSCCPNTTMCPSPTLALTEAKQCFDVGVQELLVTLPAVSDSFHPRVSFPHVSDCRLRLPTSPSSSPVFRSTKFRIVDKLLATPEQTVISTVSYTNHVNCVHLFNLQCTVGQIQNVILVAVVNFGRILQSFSSLSLRFLNESVLSNSANFPPLVALSLTNFTKTRHVVLNEFY